MEAPKKLYLIQDNGLICYCRNNKDDIEYTRTDAFIEKAKSWFEKQNEWHGISGIKHCDTEDFEDFRKYMKGE